MTTWCTAEELTWKHSIDLPYLKNYILYYSRNPHPGGPTLQDYSDTAKIDVALGKPKYDRANLKLGSGAWYFSLTAMDKNGLESIHAHEVSIEIKWQPEP